MTKSSQRNAIIATAVVLVVAVSALAVVLITGQSEPAVTVAQESTTASSTGVTSSGTVVQSETSGSTTEESTVNTSTQTATTEPDLQTTTVELAPDGPKSLLVFNKITDGRDWHAAARAPANALFDQYAADFGFEVTYSNDASIFLNSDSSDFDAVVFHNTKNNVFETGELKAGFEAFIESGVNYLGIHEAAGTHNDGTTETTESEPNLNNFWPYLEDLNGSLMDDHPTASTAGSERQNATVNVLDSSHPATEHFGASFQHSTEWYNFNRIPPNATVLLAVDENTYNPNGWLNEGGMGELHPIAWHHNFGGQRAFYTAFGHYADEYTNPAVRTHIGNAVLWVLEIEN